MTRRRVLTRIAHVKSCAVSIAMNVTHMNTESSCSETYVYSDQTQSSGLYGRFIIVQEKFYFLI